MLVPTQADGPRRSRSHVKYLHWIEWSHFHGVVFKNLEQLWEERPFSRSFINWFLLLKLHLVAPAPVVLLFIISEVLFHFFSVCS